MSREGLIEEGDGRQWEHTVENDYVCGTLVGRRTFDGGQYEPAEMLTIEATELWEGGEKQENDTVTVLCGRTALRNKVEERDPQVGDTVEVLYKGEKLNKRGDNSYHDYGFKSTRTTARDAAVASAGKEADW